MDFQINDNVSWVGKIDWDLRSFHGDQLKTPRGSSYNSYLIRGEKTAIIDTVWQPFTNEFIENLSRSIDIDSIDYVIALHAEPDHSGALPRLMEMLPGRPVYCTQSGVKSLKGYYHQDWNFVPVKTGDKLSLGPMELTFIEASMLHWPDTMMCYLDKGGMLFSSDVFGQHFASQFMYADLENMPELMYEAMKYYANIVAPYSKKVMGKLEELAGLKLSIEMVCPAHGVMWRGNQGEIIEKYAQWASGWHENRITVIYDTMYGSTRMMGEAIAEGIRRASPDCEVKLLNSAVTDSSDILTEVFRSKGIAVGSPTYNSGILNSVAAILEEIKGMVPLGKKAAAFGSYGWAPKSTKTISDMLAGAGFEVIGQGLKAQWAPDSKALGECFEFGMEFARAFNEKQAD